MIIYYESLRVGLGVGGGLTSFKISPAYFIMTLTMLEFYRGPHECVPCGCAHEYKICLLSGIMFLNHIHSVKRRIATPPPPPLALWKHSGYESFLRILFISPSPDVFPNLIVVLNW